MTVVLVVSAIQLFLALAVTAAFLWYFSSEVRSIVAGAPFSPMPSAMVGPLLDMVPLGPGDALVDLGCGDGRILGCALTRGAGSAKGYDVGWWPLMLARRRLRRWGRRVQLVRGDARTADIASATVVYMYLYPKLVDQLAPVLARRLGSGCRILSPAFPIDTAKHGAFELLETRKVGTINGYLYRRK